MGSLENLAMGFSIALQPAYLLYGLTGCILGTITGVLPGLGPLGAMAILLSFTLNMDEKAAMILFAGIYYGAMYGGSITSILLNVPGEAASVVTCIDGHKMAQKGRAGAALTISAVGSFVAGTISIVGLMLAASTLSQAALKFGPAEFVAIGVCGLLILVRLSEAPLIKSVISVLLGLVIATVGMDSISGVNRFTFGNYELSQGIDFLPVAMGMFGIAEVLAGAGEKDMHRKMVSVRFRDLMPTMDEWKRSVAPIFRGSFIGFLIGLLPGPSPVISTFVSYVTEKKISKHPEEFGQGAIEGVAGPEAANNASVGGAYVPLLALGIPFTPALAVVLGALMLHNVTPGPSMIQERPEIFWTVIASMYVGNVMLLVLNIPFVGVFAKIMDIAKPLLFSGIFVLCFVGVYSLGASFVDLMVLVVFGLIGFVIRGIGFEPAPMVLAMVVGPMIENALRQAMKISGGDIGAIVFRPISFTLYLLVIISLISPYLIKVFRTAKNRP
jgi:putative tricarboxylic transport membrane protein